MAKNQYIAWILILLLLVTLFNLFYKPWIQLSKYHHILPESWFSSHPVYTSLCPIHGFKCPTSESCDCSDYCSNGQAYDPYRVQKGEKMFVLDRQLTPGTYCLPKGAGECYEVTTYPVFSLTGWSCISHNESIYRENQLLACQYEGAQDSKLNNLWDYKLNRKANHQEIDDYYELLPGKMFRYRCKCESKDELGKQLVEALPFTCAPDYCIRDIPNPLPSMGWNKDTRTCDCLVYDHKNPLDPTSPCVAQVTKIEQNKLVGRVECTTNTIWKKNRFFCPNEEGVLSFTSLVTMHHHPEVYLNNHLDTKVI